MWKQDWREQAWGRLEESGIWDVVIVGGGITGAGVLREAVRVGLRAVLLEQNDFAWGTSSRSSKLVHGGFRYLKEGKVRLTRSSVHEREQLLHEAPGLIDPLGFLMTIYHGDFPGRWTMEVGLTVYDLLALRWDHAFYSPEDFQMLAPGVATGELECGFRYGDAQTDDARLVLRLIREAVDAGGLALNYTRVESLVYDSSVSRGEGVPDQDSVNALAGVRMRDALSGRCMDLNARAVVNATGAWADRLRVQNGGLPRIRPLRGSHLIFPAWRLPVAQAVTFWHPVDGRPVFIFPWEGITLVGTTDVDHAGSLDEEPGISPQETAYLLAAVESRFPAFHITPYDVQAAYAGVRPVIGSGKEDPSKESRDHVVWEENGLLTVTGGKLTTFRLIALDVLKALRQRLGELPEPQAGEPVLEPVGLALLDRLSGEIRVKTDGRGLDEVVRQRLIGRYGREAQDLIAAALPGELEPIPGTSVLWAELRWGARAEGVVHMDDLLLRRVRLGLLLPNGGRGLMPQIRTVCQPELAWSDERWEREEKAYLVLCKTYYNIPASALIPDWKLMLDQARQHRTAEQPVRRKVIIGSGALVGLVAAAAAWCGWVFLRRRWLAKRV